MATTFLSLTARTELPIAMPNVWNTVSLDTYATVPANTTWVLLETFWPSSAASCTYGFQNGDDTTNTVYPGTSRLARFDWIPMNAAKTLKLFCNYVGNLKYYVRAYSNHLKPVTPVDLSSQVTTNTIVQVTCSSLPADAAGGAAIIAYNRTTGQFGSPSAWGAAYPDYRPNQQEIVALDANKSFPFRAGTTGGFTGIPNAMVVIGYIPAGRFVPNTAQAVEAITSIGTWVDTVTQLSPEKLLDIYRYRGNSSSNLFGFGTGGDTSATTNLNPNTNPLYIIPNATTGAASFWAGTSNTNAASYRVGGFVASYVEKTIGTTDTLTPDSTGNILHADSLLTLTSLTIGGLLTNSYVGQDGLFTFKMPRRQHGQTYPAYGSQALVATNVQATVNATVTLVPLSTENVVTITSVSNTADGYLQKYITGLAVGDVVAFSTPTALAVTANAIGADGLITTDYIGTQVIWIRNGTTGVMTKATITSSPGIPTTPDVFTFPRQTGVAVSTDIISGSITVAGIVTTAPISIVGGTYSINGGAYTATAGTVSSGDTVTVKLTSSANILTATEATLTIGTLSDVFVVVTTPTGAVDTTPNVFGFTTVNNRTLSTQTVSPVLTVSGVDNATDVAISITGGLYSVNGGSYTASAGNVRLGDTVTVRVTSAATFSTPTVATLTVGGVVGTFTVNTLASTQNVNICTWVNNVASPKFDGLFINGGH